MRRVEQILRDDGLLPALQGREPTAQALAIKPRTGNPNWDWMAACLRAAHYQTEEHVGEVWRLMGRPQHEISGYTHFYAMGAARMAQVARDNGVLSNLFEELSRWLSGWLWFAKWGYSEETGVTLMPGCRVSYEPATKETPFRTSINSAWLFALEGSTFPVWLVQAHPVTPNNPWFAGVVAWVRLRAEGRVPHLEPVPPALTPYRPALDLAYWHDGETSVYAAVGEYTCQDNPVPVIVNGEIPHDAPPPFEVNDDPQLKDVRERHKRSFLQARCTVRMAFRGVFRARRLSVRMDGRMVPGGRHAPPEREVHWRKTLDLPNDGVPAWTWFDGRLNDNADLIPDDEPPREDPPRKGTPKEGGEGNVVRMKVWIGPDKAPSLDEAWEYVQENLLSRAGREHVQREVRN